MIYFAGHGSDVDTNNAYLLPANARLNTAHAGGIRISHVQDQIAVSKAAHKVLVVDACHSGEAVRDVRPMTSKMISDLSSGEGIYTIASCNLKERSNELDRRQQGVFSAFFADALEGHCPPDGLGRLSLDAVYNWTHEQVTEWARKNSCEQTPRRFEQKPIAMSRIFSCGRGEW